MALFSSFLTMNRREFISWVGVGSIATSLPIALVACSSQDAPPQSQTPPPATSAARSDGFVAIGSVADLDQNGQLSQKVNDKAVVVLRSSADAKTVLAVDSTCTHNGCTVAWQKSDQALVCPCHGSKFASDGKVLGGPASAPLKTFVAKIDGDQVLVKVG
jgi:cytochrome b6-f complex iron-sulfur subunit